MATDNRASLRPKDAAALLGIGVSTMWRWVNEREGFPKPIRLSVRCTVIPADELLAWRDAQEKATRAQLPAKPVTDEAAA